MGKEFESYFTELQTDMVAICLEYVNHKADNIYIYCSYEPQVYVFDVFFHINGQVVHKGQLNNLKSKYFYDDSRKRQRAMLRLGNKNLQLIHKKSDDFNREMPTEMKLYYDVKKNSLTAKYKYDLVYSNDDKLLPDNIFDEWFEEVKNKIEG